MIVPRTLAIFASLAILFAGTGCDRRKAKLSDEQMRIISAEFPGMTAACLDKLRYGGTDAMPSQTDQCFGMTPSQRWRGIWRDEFEGSLFCPAPAQSCPTNPPGENIWLSFLDEAAGPRRRKPRGAGDGKLYVVDFIGRKTLRPGHHGHMGMSEHEIVVEKLNAFRPIEEK